MSKHPIAALVARTARIPTLLAILVVAPFVFPPASPASAQAAGEAGVLTAERYLTPPDEIREALEAPWHTNVELDDVDPTGRWFVIEQDASRMPSIEAYAKKWHNLGGLQIDPAANRDRRFTTDAASSLRLRSWQDGREVRVGVPDGARVSNVAFSPDGSRLAFFAHFDDATHIYTADPTNGRSRRLTRTPVLATLVTDFEWSGDGGHIFTVLVPEDRGAEPVEPAVASTPGIWMAEPGEENATRTYPSLLESPYEFDLLEHYTVGQLARIQVDNRRVRTVGAPAMISDIDPAPSGDHVIVETVTEYSDIVPVYAFGSKEEIWDLDGRVLSTLATNGVRDGSDDDDDEEDVKRNVAWRPDGLGLSYIERPRPDTSAADSARDADAAGADRPASQRRRNRNDRVMQWLPPFAEGTATLVHEVDGRASGVSYDEAMELIFITQRSGGEETVYAAPIGAGAADTTYTIYEHDTDEFYEDPGSLQMKQGRLGEYVVRRSRDGASVYLAGTQYFENPLERAPRPFVDRVAIRTGDKGRIFESAADRYESVEAVLDDDYGRVVISRESPTEVPQFFLKELASGDERQLTQNRDFTPDLTSRAQRHVVQVERPDGAKLWVHVTLPADYRPGTRLPAMFWHYPREYESQEDYDESNRRYNKNDFPGIAPRSMEHLLRRGWAVVQPDVAIIGPRERWNDYYVLHLRNSLSAAIDSLDARGWIDRRKLAIGGHSYGGFGTLNSMIHTPFFKAGIAGASNTNRTLTPAGFQREPRTLWESRETYVRMSPLFWLNELSGALLMYHDMEDQNVGTFPVNSWRAFHALNALGKTAALYMYPYEAHGPRADATIMDLWSRWIAWLDMHVLGVGAGEGEVVTEEGSGS